jgi:hypothetical protein
MEKIIYKGIEITKIHETSYVFEFNGLTYVNTNLRFAKVMIGRVISRLTK